MLYVVLDNIRSALNVGAIFRTADALGVRKIYLCGTTPCPGQSGRAGRDLSKTALGAESAVAWERTGYVGNCVKRLKSSGVFIVALEQAPRAMDIREFIPPENYALVLGMEVSGLAPRVLSRCDKIVYIPMFGRKESLNVSVAFGVAGYLLKFINKRKRS